MTTYCQNKKDWATKTPKEKLKVVKKLVNETLWDEATPPVEFKVVKDLETDEDSLYGAYSEGVIEIDKDHLENGDYEEVANTAFHEARHAVNSWDQEADTTVAENGLTIKSRGKLDEEEDAQDYAKDRLEKEKKKCEKPKGTESSSKKTLPKGSWNSPSSDTKVV